MRTLKVVGKQERLPPVAGLWDGCISFWHLDEASGPTAYDSVGSNNLTFYSAPAPIVGRVCSALHFDGTDDGLKKQPGAVFLQTPAYGSAVAWVRVPDEADNTGAFLSIDTAPLCYIAGNRDVYLCWRAVCSGTGWDALDGSYYGYFFGPQFSANEWHHIAFTWGGNIIRLYMDGELAKESTNCIVSTNRDVSTLTVGQYWDSQYLHADIDEVGLWGKALSLAEVRVLARKG